MSEQVLVTRDHSVMVITINRPAVRNAINREVSLRVADAVDELDADGGLQVGILTGAGGTFCAGMDLKAFLADEDVRPNGRGLAGICRKRPAKPMIAAVDGPALAGGCEIALACDLIVAGEDAIFGIPEVRRGLIAGDGGLLLLPRRLPAAIAMELALTGAPLSAADARRFGLVNRVTEAGHALDGALDLARQITNNAPLAVAASREIVASALDHSVVEGFQRQDQLLSQLLASEDAREGARAFTEKRSPVWRGA